MKNTGLTTIGAPVVLSISGMSACSISPLTVMATIRVSAPKPSRSLHAEIILTKPQYASRAGQVKLLAKIGDKLAQFEEKEFGKIAGADLQRTICRLQTR